MYHNAELLLKNYRNIVWILECFPSFIVEELDRPMNQLDTILNYFAAAMGCSRGRHGHMVGDSDSIREYALKIKSIFM